METTHDINKPIYALETDVCLAAAAIVARAGELQELVVVLAELLEEEGRQLAGLDEGELHLLEQSRFESNLRRRVREAGQKRVRAVPDLPGDG